MKEVTTMAFRCPACGAEFETQEALDAHTREAHEPEQTGGFRCPACGAEFETQDALDEHEKSAHGA
jgi:uncharacterized C2H2 Zn-finger protein